MAQQIKNSEHQRSRDDFMMMFEKENSKFGILI